MADDKQIKIAITTEADTSGADKATAALQQVKSAAAAQSGGEGAAAPVTQAAAAMAKAADEIDQSAVRIIATTRKVQEAVADDGPQSTPATPAAAAALKKIEDEATAAAEAVDRARKAAEQAGPLTELQKLEFELRRITEEAKVLDAALEKVQRGKLSLPSNAVASISNRVNQADIQVEMLQPQIEAQQKAEQAAKAEGEAQAAAARKKEEAAAAAKKLREETRQANQEQAALGRTATGLRGALSGVLGQMGPLGAAISALSSPWALLGVAMGAATGLVAKGIAMLITKVKEQEETMRWAAQGAEKFRTSLFSLREENERLRQLQLGKDFDEFIQRLEAATQEIDRQTKAVDRNIEALRAKRRAQMSVTEAEADRQISVIDDAERRGEIVPAEATKRRNAVRTKLEDARVAADEADRQSEIAQIQNRLQQAKAKPAATEAELRGLTARDEQLKQQLVQFDALNKARAGNDNRIGKITAELRDLESLAGASEGIMQPQDVQKSVALEQEKRELEKANQRLKEQMQIRYVPGKDEQNRDIVKEAPPQYIEDAQKEQPKVQEEIANKDKRLKQEKIALEEIEPDAKARLAVLAQESVAAAEVAKRRREALERRNAAAEEEAAKRTEDELRKMKEAAADLGLDRLAGRLNRPGVNLRQAAEEIERAKEAKRIQDKEAQKRKKEETEKEQVDREAAGLGDTVLRSANQVKLLNPAQSAKVRKAAETLRDGAKPGEAAGVAQVLDQVLSLLERAGQGQSNQAIELEATKRRLQNLESKFKTSQRGSGK